MPHMEMDGDTFQVPSPEQLAPENLLPPTPRRQQEPPLGERKTTTKRKRRSMLGSLSIKKFKPSAEMEAEMEGIVRSRLGST